MLLLCVLAHDLRVTACHHNLHEYAQSVLWLTHTTVVDIPSIDNRISPLVFHGPVIG